MISWFTRNPVAANLLMILIFICGVMSAYTRIPLEVFPDFAPNILTVRVPYRGASPEDVERGVLTRMEQAVQDLVGIEKMTSRAQENLGTLTLEIDDSNNFQSMIAEVKNRIDSISTFPEQTERPVYSQNVRRRELISVAIYGNVTEGELKVLSENFRNKLLSDPQITQVDIGGVRKREISLSIDLKKLEAHNISINELKNKIREQSLDLPSGKINTPKGRWNVRTQQLAEDSQSLSNLIISIGTNGEVLKLSDVATIKDEFEEEPLTTHFNGKRAAFLEIYRVGNQNAITLSNKIKEIVSELKVNLPEGIEMTTWRDRSRIVKARLGTLTRSAVQGGLLVFLVLGLFLRFKLALWVCLGIPVSFMGAVIFMPFMGISINIFSLFAFILVLGIVVDDAIVTGENIFSTRSKMNDPLLAAIQGTKEVALPVTFGILTTIVAFIPTMMIEGRRGLLFANIAGVVIAVLIFSLIESKLILPAHLSHLPKTKTIDDEPWYSRWQQYVARGLEKFILIIFKPLLDILIKNKYIVLAITISFSAFIIAMVYNGTIRFTFFPRVQSETARATLIMPEGTPAEYTNQYVDKMKKIAHQLQKKYTHPETGQSVVKNIMTNYGSTNTGRTGKSHLGRVTLELVSPEIRDLDVTTTQIVSEWKKKIGPIPGAKGLNYRAEIGRSGSPISLQLSSNNYATLKEAATIIKNKLNNYKGVFDISDTLEEGLPELRLSLTERAKIQGISLRNVSSQVRQALYGSEVYRVQQQLDDIRVIIRLPIEQREGWETLQNLRVKIDHQNWVPLSHIAKWEISATPSIINRVRGLRTVDIEADIVKGQVDMTVIKDDLTKELDNLISQYSDLSYRFEGEMLEREQSFGSLQVGLIFSLICIYALLAIPFKSYLQPFIVMSVIPYGVVGAILGHWLMGFNLSLMSLLGMLALIGVVVNDSLVLVDFVNKKRIIEKKSAGLSALEGSVARFRAILLTSITTFCGLIPLLLEDSTQSKFLAPMAISLGFGVLFSTFVTLVIVPIHYLLLEDFKRFFNRANDFLRF